MRRIVRYRGGMDIAHLLETPGLSFVDIALAPSCAPTLD